VPTLCFVHGSTMRSRADPRNRSLAGGRQGDWGNARGIFSDW
jgi:hypothetical protein